MGVAKAILNFIWLKTIRGYLIWQILHSEIVFSHREKF